MTARSHQNAPVQGAEFVFPGEVGLIVLARRLVWPTRREDTGHDWVLGCPPFASAEVEDRWFNTRTKSLGTCIRDSNGTGQATQSVCVAKVSASLVTY